MADKQKDGRLFAQRHPKWNFLIGLILLLVLLAVGVFAIYFSIKYVGIGISRFAKWISELASKLDAVIIVALITGSVSIVGVVCTSIVSKIIEYKQKRREYLYQKREEPYSDFIDVVYKIQENAKQNKKYPDNEMLEDMFKFSKKLTLWGSNRVIKKWLKFRLSSVKGLSGNETIFVMEDIMYAMRKDMGLKKMKKGNLLAFFVNDIENAVKQVIK